MENNIKQQADEKYQFLKEKGLKPFDIVNVRKAFMDYGVSTQNDRKIEKNGDYFKNKNVENYLFSKKEEAIFAEHLINFAPKDANRERVFELFTIINTLLGHNTEWCYKIK